MNIATAIAQLRHAYHNLIEGTVKDQAHFARYLLGPAIEAIERKLTPGATKKLYVLTVQPLMQLEGETPAALYSRGAHDVYLFTSLTDAQQIIPHRNADDNMTWTEHDSHGKCWTASAQREGRLRYEIHYTVHETEVIR